MIAQNVKQSTLIESRRFWKGKNRENWKVNIFLIFKF